MLLFLGLTIPRDRKVIRRPSFHYPSLAQGESSKCNHFTVELLDQKYEVLVCAPLHCGCNHGGCDCWPKVTRDAIPMPDGARWLVVWEGDHKIYEEEIPDPPTVKIDGFETHERGILLRWSAQYLQGHHLWYLVHSYDTGAGVWRGVAPRLEETSLLIPRSLFAHNSSLAVRVLATSGIATGVAEGEVQIGHYQPSELQVILAGFDDTATEKQSLSNVLYAVAVDSAGRQVPSEWITWYDNQGAEIGRGAQLDLRQIDPGRRVVRAVVRGYGGQAVLKSWLVEKMYDRTWVHHVVPDRNPNEIAVEHKHPHPY